MWYLVRASGKFHREGSTAGGADSAIYGLMPGQASLEEAKVTQESALYL